MSSAKQVNSYQYVVCKADRSLFSQCLTFLNLFSFLLFTSSLIRIQQTIRSQEMLLYLKFTFRFMVDFFN